jgi:transglutaminase-like putative cysteine protease
MQIRLGYELIYDCPQPTPMLLMLNVHYTRVSDVVVPDHLVTSPSIPIRAFRDGFGNWCSRIVAPAGRTRLSASGIVNDTGELDLVASEAEQHTVDDLPDEALVFLLGSRYCETDRLSDIAWSLFGKTPRSAGAASRPSATTSTSTSPLATNTRVPAARVGKRSATAPAFAGTMLTWRSPSVAA